METEKKTADCGIEYTEVQTDKGTRYRLNNGLTIDHIPTTLDVKTNNLKPNNSVCRTEKERKELSTKAGIKSGESRQKQKTFKELGEKWLGLKCNRAMIREVLPEEITEEQIKQLAADGITLKDLIILAQTFQAISGSDRSAVFVRDTIGEKPIDRSEVVADVMTDGDRALIEKLCKRNGIEG